MNTILFEPDEVTSRGVVRLRGERARHVRAVLHAKPGDTLRVGLLDGPAGKGTVRSVTDLQVTLHCAFETAVPGPEPMDILLALPRPKVLRRLVPQLSALGVGHIFLTNAWRVEKAYFHTHVLEPAFLRAGLIEGLRQAAATRVPGISVHRHLRRLIEEELAADLPPGTDRLLAHPREAVRLGEWVPSPAKHARALLAVGPEGGWIEREVELFRKHGFQCVGLGSRILRSDTACIALMSVLRERLDRFERRKLERNGNEPRCR